MIFCFLTAAAVLAYFGWHKWESHALEKAAEATLEEAGNLLRETEGEPDLSTFEEEFNDARRNYDEGRRLHAEEQHEEALRNGRRSVALLSSILSALRDQGEDGEAHVISLAGRVEFKRGEFAEWEEARVRQSLRSGFFVRTTRNASAEIMFVDGTLYNVRPDTLFVVSGSRGGAGAGGSGQSIRMQYGLVDLSTSKRPSRVATPEAEAEVEQDSTATVAYDDSANAGRFATYRGQMKVATASGRTQNVGALQQVTQRRGELSEPHPIPRAPDLIEPVNSHEQKDSDPQIRLSWKRVNGASHYQLQVSRNHLFADNIIDVDRRTKTTATLGVRGAGSFVWRVAAVDASNRRGPWSAVNRFRISTERGEETSGGATDTVPPPLSLDNPQAYGSIFIISGATEPGAIVTVRGEPVTVAADGSFAKTLQVYDNGWTFVEVRAKDAYGNESSRPIRLYVDNL